MNSYLLIAGTKKEQLQKINTILAEGNQQFPEVTSQKQRNPDLLFIQPENSIGISEIRKLQKFLSRKPYQEEIQVAIITEAQELTLQAQNAFLKTLEEPPAKSRIFLMAENKSKLLPTITSRCQINNLAQENRGEINAQKKQTCLQLLRKILQVSVGKRLKIIKPYCQSREKALQLVEEAIFSLRGTMIEKNNSKKQIKISKLLKKLQKAEQQLEQNINTKLVLQNLVINL